MRSFFEVTPACVKKMDADAFRSAVSVERQRVSSAQNVAKPTVKDALKGGTVELERKITKYSSSRGRL